MTENQRSEVRGDGSAKNGPQGVCAHVCGQIGVRLVLASASLINAPLKFAGTKEARP
jgi:hypothetical protein